jgi:hypothetical protein
MPNHPPIHRKTRTLGRGGFGPSDQLPDAYEPFTTAMLRGRIAGKWNVRAVVANRDDHATMLAHTALQARLRKLA